MRPVGSELPVNTYSALFPKLPTSGTSQKHPFSVTVVAEDGETFVDGESLTPVPPAGQVVSIEVAVSVIVWVAVLQALDSRYVPSSLMCCKGWASDVAMSNDARRVLGEQGMIQESFYLEYGVGDVEEPPIKRPFIMQTKT